MNHSEMIIIDSTEWIALTIHSVPAVNGCSYVFDIRIGLFTI